MYMVLFDTRRFAQGPFYLCAHLFLHPLKTHPVTDPVASPFYSSRSSDAWSHHHSLTCDWSQVTNMDLSSASPLWTSPDPHPGCTPGCVFCWAFAWAHLQFHCFSHPPLLLPPWTMAVHINENSLVDTRGHFTHTHTHTIPFFIPGNK